MRTRDPRSAGTSRSLLLVALGAAVVVIVASGIYLVNATVTGGAGGGDDPDGMGPVALEPPGTGLGHPGRGGVRRPGAPSAAEDGADELDPTEDDDIFIPPGGPRTPEGDVFVVDDASVRECLEKKLWEELRRQILVLEDEGKQVPADVVQALLALLADDRWGIDASLTLGGVHDATVGRMLADLAVNASASDEARTLALKALAASGQAAGLAQVRGLVEHATEDTKLVRAAYLALGGMGGAEGVKSLLDALAAHPSDSLTDAVQTALAKSRDSDAALAQALRDARNAADPSRIELVLGVGSRIGDKAGDAFRREVRALAESAAGLSSLDGDPASQERLRFSAVAIVASMGPEGVETAIGLVRSESGALRINALNALRLAKGDEAAADVASLLKDQTDQPARYAVAASLGEIGSRRGTPTLHALLDDPDAQVREIAAASLTKVRDPASTPVILSRIDGAKGDRTMAMNYVQALGRIGVNTALPKLNELLLSKDPFWVDLQPWVRQAITRIEAGDPDATSIAPARDRR